MRTASHTWLRCARVGLSASIVALASVGAHAAVIIPNYSVNFTDDTTFQNQTLKTDGKYGWSITPGADSYQDELYERPVTQSFENMTADGGGSFVGTKEYYQNLDIMAGRAGFDDTYLYVGIEMVGQNNVTENGNATLQALIYNYMFLVGTASDGAGGFMLVADAPTLADGGSTGAPNTSFTGLKTTGYEDTNGDVGGSGALDGLSVTKSDDAAAALGNGYDLSLIGDGLMLSGPDAGAETLFARINPLNFNEVEFALNYSLLGLSTEDILAILAGNGFLDLRAVKGGVKDPQNFLWNDEYTSSEAGSPYSTPGLGNIYESDNLRLAAPGVPEPGTWAMMILGFGAIGAALRKSKSRLTGGAARQAA